MGTTTRKGTQYFYRSAYRAYADFTGMTATQLIDEAVEDMQRDVRQRQDVVKTRLRNFYEWLVKEFPVHSRGNSRGTKAHEVVRKGLREKSANAFVMAVRSFYATYDITVKLKGRERLPRPKVYNKRMQLSTLNVKALVDHARSPRDRAIILTTFQCGADVSTLCGMTYGDVSDGLAKNEYPLKLELQRPKTGVDYFTFLGRDAINAIRAYLNDARSRGMQFKADTPLFVQEVKGKRGEPLPIDTYVVQKVMREVAVRSGLVDSENNGKDMNPVSPHALRESLGSILTNSGVPDTIVDFWLGHEIGTMAEAYKGGRFNELKTMYAQKEPLISITASESQTIEEVRSALGTEITKLAERVAELEDKLKWAVDEIENLETDSKGYTKEDEE